jgi:spermidine/putrescine transport system substrate-binding protein
MMMDRLPDLRAPAFASPFSRRRFLRAAAGAAGVTALGPMLAACSSTEEGPPFEGAPSGVVNVANWPLYLDRGRDADGNVTRPSLLRFTEDTGIAVNYREVIPDAEAFYQQIHPYLAAGAPTGWDVMVITNGPTLTKLIALDQLVELPRYARPNFDTYGAEELKDPDYDPGSLFTMPWQSGITGIAYNPALTGRAITSLQDLFSEEFAGRVGMFGDSVDLPNLALVAAGFDPATSTPEQWAETAELLRRQRADDIVKRYYTQNYVNALANGDVAISMAWSGDIFQENAIGAPEGLQFVIPDDGALIWTDAMCIPKGAEHTVDAITLMDYIYKPEIAAMIAGFVAYVTPVPDAQAELLRMADETSDPATAESLRSTAQSELVFPTPEQRAALKTYRELATDEELTLWNATFGEFFV